MKRRQKEDIGRARRKRTRLGDRTEDPSQGGALFKSGGDADDASDSDVEDDSNTALAKPNKKGNPLLVDLVRAQPNSPPLVLRSQVSGFWEVQCFGLWDTDTWSWRKPCWDIIDC